MASLLTNFTAAENDLSIERGLLLQAIRMKYGYDFTNYAQASMARQIDAAVKRTNSKSPIELLDRLLKQRSVFDQVLPQLLISTSEMFRDGAFFKLLRSQVVPILKTFPTLTVWSAGCGNGEEVYSLAILLEEEGLLDRTTIFATDVSPKCLRSAKDGIFPAEQMKVNTRNYVESGGLTALNRYYSSDYGLIKMNKDLMRNTVFSEHNLVTDHVFTEAHLILCRNVLIYFDRELQERALTILTGSLARGGTLGLGSHESVRLSPAASRLERVSEKWRIFRG